SITIEDQGSVPHPFTAIVSRGDGRVRALFDVDKGNTVSRSVSVPVRLPGYDFWASLFPSLASAFTFNDQLDYTATPQIRVMSGTTDLTSGCTNTPGDNQGTAVADGGQSLDCTFTQAGTYRVEVTSKYQFAANTRSGLAAVDYIPATMPALAQGQRYELLVSLQHMETNNYVGSLSRDRATL